MDMREAVRSDLPDIVRLIAEDQLGATRERLEDPLPRSYSDAFEAIDADPNQLLLVLADPAMRTVPHDHPGVGAPG